MLLKGPTAFLISKPLQLMVSLLVLRQLQLDQKPLFLVTDSFRGASDVVSRMQEIYPDEIDAIFMTTPADAFAYLAQEGFGHVLIDSDVGFRKFLTLAKLKLFCRNVRIYVFEEGTGSYRVDLYAGLKQHIFSGLGIATHFGGSLFTDKIFVLKPEDYSAAFPNLSERAVRINYSMTEFLRDEHEKLKALFGFNGFPHSASPKKSVCRIYLASWRVNEAFLGHFRTLTGDLFVKAHPHSESEDFPSDITTIDPGAPAELAIADLLQLYEKIEIFHHNSSTRLYITSPEVTFQDAFEFEFE